MRKLKLAIVGLGNMGSEHLKNIGEGKISNVECTAVCDIDSEKLSRYETLYPDVKPYDAFETMLAQHDADAVLIAVPHYFHPSMAIQAFKAGYHVITEKPAGVYSAQVLEMISEAKKHPDLVFGIMYNQRTNPVFQKARELITTGQLGNIVRSSWIVTDWYRNQAYYNSSSWRATWYQEGGGVLINQAAHQLDLWQWMMDTTPESVTAFCKYGVNRDIPVENDVTAYVDFKNGSNGVFITSAHDVLGCNRLEIDGDRGRLLIENGKIEFMRMEISEKEFSDRNIDLSDYLRGEKRKSGLLPKIEKADLSMGEGSEWGDQHCRLLENYASAILNGTELLAPGEDGIHMVNLENAILFSSFENKTIHFPFDNDLFYARLQERIAEEKHNRKK